MDAGHWIAHRGYPAHYPENTLLGFAKAIEAGALNIECDMQLSRDGFPVVFHDESLSRLCGVPGLVQETTLAELRGLSAFEPGRFGTRFQGNRLLELADLLDFIRRHPDVTLYLEIKHSAINAFGVPGVLDRVLPLLEGLSGQVVLISFSLLVLQGARQRGYPRVAPVIRQWGQRMSRTVEALDAELLLMNYKRLPFGVKPDLNGVPVALYEISDYSLARRWRQWGACMIETDSIGEMITASGAGNSGA